MIGRFGAHSVRTVAGAVLALACLEAIDPSALARAERALAGVRAAVEQHVAPVDIKEAVAAARATIEPLVRSSAHE